MVDTVIDPIRIPTITLSEAEYADIEALMATGALPKDYLERHFDAVEKNVFGHDHKKDRKGNPIEQGIGSPDNMTRNAVEAYRKYGKGDANYEEHLKVLEARLAECDAKRPDRRTRARRGKH